MKVEREYDASGNITKEVIQFDSVEEIKVWLENQPLKMMTIPYYPTAPVPCVPYNPWEPVKVFPFWLTSVTDTAGSPE
jgi:hypothetical protein